MSAVVVAGGQWQIPITRYLQKRGEDVYVVNPFPSEATRLADHHIQEDARDAEAILERLRAIKPSIVTSDMSDIAVMTVARLCKELGLHGNDPDAALLFTDKAAMMEHAARCGIPVPPTDDANNLAAFVGRHGYPVIVKPVDANASCGFLRLDQDTPGALEYCLSYSPTRRGIVQKYIKGAGIILDGICSGGFHQTVQAADKTYFRDGLSKTVRYQSRLELDDVIAANDRFVHESGLKFGITHSEWFVTPDGFYLLEIAARGGGYGIAHPIMPWVTGLPVYDILYDNLNGRTTEMNLYPNRKPAMIQFFEWPTGTVTGISGEESVKKLCQFGLNLKVGDVARPAKNIKEIHAYAIILKETDQEIDETVRAIHQQLAVNIEE